MSRTSVRRRAAVGGCALAMAAGTVAAAPPASAGSMSFSKSSGRMVSADWLEVGTLPGVAGNAHLGSMQVEVLSGGRANVFGVVADFECEPGATPTPPGGHHAPPEEGPCQMLGLRFIETGTASVTLDRKLTKARITGALLVTGHDADGSPTTPGRPPVDMVLTGVGAITSGTESGSFTDGTTSYRFRYSFTGRAATVAGSIGPMVFDDETGEYSSAQLGSYRSYSREVRR